MTLSENDRKTFELMLQCIHEYRNKISHLMTLYSNLQTLYMSLEHLQPGWNTEFSDSLLELELVISFSLESDVPFNEALKAEEKTINLSVADLERLIKICLDNDSSLSTSQ